MTVNAAPMPMPAPAGHTRLSPSNSSIWLNCPAGAAYLLLSPGDGLSRAGAQARLGAIKHAALAGTAEQLLADRKRLHRIWIQAALIKGLRDAAAAGDAAAGELRWTAGEIDLFARELLRIGSLKHNFKACVWVERNFEIMRPSVWDAAVPKLKFNPVIKGTADIVVITRGGVLEVIDWKTGALPVSPSASQLALYALGAYKRAQALMRERADKLAVIATIAQPQVSLSAQRYYLPQEKLLSLDLRPLTVHSGYKSAAAGSWCRFCPYRGCPQRQPAQDIMPGRSEVNLDGLPKGG